MESLSAYIPLDRRQAIERGENLPDRTHGTALMADLSGSTPLTDALVRELGPKGGAYELTRQLNAVYGALIAEVHGYGGSVVGFSGDAITCWFQDSPAGTKETGQRALGCALAMQRAMGQFARVETPSGMRLSLAIKVGIASGPARRFRVGDPKIQSIDVLAGATLERVAAAEKQAREGEVLVNAEMAANLGEKLLVAEWRAASPADTSRRFAVAAGLTDQEPARVPTIYSPVEVDSLTEDQICPWLLPPVYERLRAGRGRFLAEIRPAVALFLRFAGLDYDQDDAAGGKLDAYVRLVQNVLAYYEGYLIQLTIDEKGSYLYAAFGAPLAHDDDPSRAVATALELRSPPAELEIGDGVQIGISQGRMRAGAYGGPTRRTYGVLGDEVNLAARLMQAAGPGQIVVSQRIADAIARDYQLDYIGPVHVKGKREPVLISTVRGRRSPSLYPTLSAGYSAPLVSREGELKQMEGILAPALTGKGGILGVEGAAGVGKSHLAAEFVERALGRGLRVAVGACHSTTQYIPYYPWRQVFRTLFDLNDQLPGQDRATWVEGQVRQVEAMVTRGNLAWRLRLPLLGDLMGLPIPDNPTTQAFDPQLRQEALFALTVDLVRTWARAHPLLLLLEDVHWLDEASLRLTLALGRIIADLPILLVLTHRPHRSTWLVELNRLSACHLLHLGELPEQGISDLVAHRLGGQPSVLALALIQFLSQGNPFFAEELLITLRESGQLRRGGDGVWTLSETLFDTLRGSNCLARDARGEWMLAPDAPLSAVDLGIPDSVHGLVLSGLDRLAETAKLTLKVASVIGRSFDLDLLTRSHPTQPDQTALLEQLQALQARDLIRSETHVTRPAYTFKHHIIQETVYETLPINQQRELHQAVGAALEGLQPEAVEGLAYHYLRGGARDKSLHYLDQAARKTRRDYANETALNYYNQALALEERPTWRQGQVEVLHILGRREEEAAGLETLEADPSAHAFEIAYLWGQYHEALGNYTQAQAAVERALTAGRAQGDLEGELRCLSQLGLIAYRQGDYQDAQTWFHQALALHQPEEAYPTEIRQAFAQAFSGLGAGHIRQGDLHQAQLCYEQALALSRVSGDRQVEANALNGLGATACRQRLFSEARAYQEQALAIQRAIGDRAGEATSLYNLAQAHCDAGDYGQAHKYSLAALEMLRATGNRWQQIHVWNDLGILYRELGDLAQAQTCLEKGLALAQEIGAQESMGSYLISNLGLVLQEQGKLEEAERLLSEGLALMEAIDNRHQMAYFLSYLSTASLRAGHPEQVIARANRALGLWKALNIHLGTADDLATLAAAHLATGELAQALACAEQALAILDECGGEGPDFPQRDYWIAYQVLEAAGQPEKAQAALRSAYELVLARADKITDPAMRQSFLERVAVNKQIIDSF
jgi:predicted ATPase/class 3 adenylate cyclase